MWKKINTEYSGKNKGEIKPSVFGAPNGISKNINHQRRIPEMMSEIAGDLDEKYKEIKRNIFQKAIEKGIFSKEKIKEKKLLTFPLMHVTNESKIPMGVSPYTDLVLYQQFKNLERSKGGNTNEDDVARGRDKFVYFLLGKSYFSDTNRYGDAFVMCYDSELIKERNCFIQDPFILEYMNYREQNTENKYDHLNRSTLSRCNWLECISLLLAFSS